MGDEHFMQKIKPTNQIQENQCIGLNGEFVKHFLPAPSIICGVKTEQLGLKPYRNP
jgi:hypothetical protein